MAEVQEHGKLLTEEKARLARAQVAGRLLGPIRVTNCPACDQPVTPSNVSGECFLCKKPVPHEQGSLGKLVTFELERLDAEVTESAQLLEKLAGERARRSKEMALLLEKVSRMEEVLRPVRGALSALVDQRVSGIDVLRGRLHEQLQQLRRIETTFHTRTQLADQIADIQKKAAELQEQVNRTAKAVDLESSGDLLEDGFNDYLNALKAVRTSAWSQSSIAVRIGERDFSVLVGGRKWNKQLGGTLTLYFLMAYHYALMRLTSVEACRYPGLCLLDFPPKLDDGTTVADEEAIALRPFVSLLGRKEMANTQVIAAGSGIGDLVGSHPIHLANVWK